jgi:hypothetical protein
MRSAAFAFPRLVQDTHGAVAQSPHQLPSFTSLGTQRIGHGTKETPPGSNTPLSQAGAAEIKEETRAG